MPRTLEDPATINFQDEVEGKSGYPWRRPDAHILTMSWARWCHPDGPKTIPQAAELTGYPKAEVAKWTHKFMGFINNRTGFRFSLHTQAEAREYLLPMFERFVPVMFDEHRAVVEDKARRDAWRQFYAMVPHVLPEVTKIDGHQKMPNGNETIYRTAEGGFVSRWSGREGAVHVPPLGGGFVDLKTLRGVTAVFLQILAEEELKDVGPE